MPPANLSGAAPSQTTYLEDPLAAPASSGACRTSRVASGIAALGRTSIRSGTSSLLRRSRRRGTGSARSLARLVSRGLGLLHLAASGRQIAVGFHLLLERLGSHRLGMGLGLRGLLGRQGCRLSRSRSLGIGRRVARHRFGSHLISRRRRHFRIKPHGLGAFHRGRRESSSSDPP